jgi:four helix bundle protein
MGHTKVKQYHELLQDKIDTYVHYVYAVSRKFPKDELYGVTSQLRRASLSVALNYIEGFARLNEKVDKNFLKISYGSLKEAIYLLKFSYDEHYMTDEDYKKANAQADELGAMIWGIISKI